MRPIVIIILVLLILLAGCKQDLSPTQIVTGFIEAVGSGHPEKTANMINGESQIMIKTNLIQGCGIAWISTKAARSEQGYKLVMDNARANRATVRLKGAYADTAPFIKSGFPPKLREQGVSFYLVKNSGIWKIDLIRTEDELFRIGQHHLSSINNGVEQNSIPLWMPTPIGLPPTQP